MKSRGLILAQICCLGPFASLKLNEMSGPEAWGGLPQIMNARCIAARFLPYDSLIHRFALPMCCLCIRIVDTYVPGYLPKSKPVQLFDFTRSCFAPIMFSSSPPFICTKKNSIPLFFPTTSFYSPRTNSIISSSKRPERLARQGRRCHPKV